MKYIYVVLISLFFTFFGFSQIKKSLKVFTDYNFFYDPTSGEYIEFKFQFDTQNLEIITNNNWHSSRVKVQIMILKDTNKIINKQYFIESPRFQDSLNDDFFDVRRLNIKPGNYDLILSFKDANSTLDPIISRQKIHVPDFHSNFAISDIQICDNIRESKEENILSKSGYDLFPRLVNYFPSDCLFLPTYLEIYNPQNDSTLLRLKTVFYSMDNKIEKEQFANTVDVVVSKVTPIIQKNDISLLPSGSYRLVYLLMKDSLVLTSSSYYFDRTNDLPDFISSDNIVLDPIFQSSVPNDSLEYYLASIIPVANSMEVPIISKIIKEHDIAKIRKYIQSFWITTAGRINATSAWLKYKEQVKMVERTYSTSIFKGYETDRGRVYLKYGAPTAIATRETSPSEYPYEIWQYDKIKQFSNKRFIFYNPDLVNNHYQLLHSDMQGELKNYRWQQLLTKRNSPNQNIDDPNDGNKDHYGGESSDVFQQY